MVERYRIALVTGCSSGIGRATVLELAKAGYRVYATARDVRTLDQFKSVFPGSGLGVTTERLDVTDHQTISNVVSRIGREAGHLDVLINNAGYALLGALEEIPPADFRKQMEVNVFGLMTMTLAALPLIRRAGGGTIINVSSVAGRISVPVMGAYCASKFCVEALTHSLRAELHRFGIRVVSVEPGPVKTKFHETAMRESRHILENQESGYTRAYNAIREMYKRQAKGGAAAEEVAKVILRAVEAKRPRARYTIKAKDRLFISLESLIATRVGQRYLRKYFSLETG